MNRYTVAVAFRDQVNALVAAAAFVDDVPARNLESCRAINFIVVAVCDFV